VYAEAVSRPDVSTRSSYPRCGVLLKACVNRRVGSEETLVISPAGHIRRSRCKLGLLQDKTERTHVYCALSVVFERWPQPREVPKPNTCATGLGLHVGLIWTSRAICQMLGATRCQELPHRISTREEERTLGERGSS